MHNYLLDTQQTVASVKTVTCMVRQEQQNQSRKHFHVDSWKHSDDNSTTITTSTRHTAQYLDNNQHILYHTNGKY